LGVELLLPHEAIASVVKIAAAMNSGPGAKLAASARGRLMSEWDREAALMRSST
jgi:hypothetical protein